jgi:outer membrane receptor protein involved in Fe transport
LHDLQKAIELNDNRAVYRSKLLLDSDQAARSASLARIYGDLGFQQLALVEGWKSVNTDPSNFSAHRFLADSYSALPRHEIARVSELLQSQLLQPSNITPIQPRLAESNQFLISAQGPGALSFTEFNPIFNRNRAAAQVSGTAGENSTWGGEGIVSGIYNRLSFSAGYTHFETDGWRTNANQDDEIANVFAQYEISPQTSIQAEYRYRKIKNGDLQMRFFADDFLQNLKEENETETVRFGFRQAFSPSSVLVGNFMYQNADRSEQDQPLDILTTDLKGEDKAYSAELSYLFRSESFNLVAGGGYFKIDSQDEITTVLSPPPIIIPPPFPPLPPIIITIPPITDAQTIDRDVKHTNLYLYSYLNFLKNLTVTLGASGDFYSRDLPGSEDKDQFNPKFGITWNPLPDTTLRGAVFRTLKRTLITDQTLEPTQVAGFNQFFDDDNGTSAWNYGAAVDQKFSKSIYGGMGFTYRDLEVPFVALTPTPQSLEADSTDKIFRAYLFWTPHNWLALSAEYLYEDLDIDPQIAEGAREVETHYFPLGVSFFHPCGLGAGLRATYVNQEGLFDRRMNAGVFESGEDDFWVVDAALTYRLPKRYGFITAGVTNLFDKQFNYYSSDRDNPRYQPDRVFFAKVTLAIP